MVIRGENDPFDALEGAIDDPGRLSDPGILKVLHLHSGVDKTLYIFDLCIGNGNRFRMAGIAKDSYDPVSLQYIQFDLIVHGGQLHEEVPGEHGHEDLLAPVNPSAPDLNPREKGMNGLTNETITDSRFMA